MEIAGPGAVRMSTVAVAVRPKPFVAVTGTLATPTTPARLRARAVMRFRPFASETLSTAKALFDGVNGMPLTSPETASAETVPVTRTVDVPIGVSLDGGAVIVIVGADEER